MQTGDIATKTAQAPSVETVTLTETKITPYHTFIGRTEAVNDVDIMPRVGGELTAIHFKDGDMVEKANCCLKSTTVLTAALAYAKASLQKQKHNSFKLRVMQNVKKLIKDKASVSSNTMTPLLRTPQRLPR